MANIKCRWELRRIKINKPTNEESVYKFIPKGISIGGRGMDAYIQCANKAVSRKHFSILLSEDGSLFIKDHNTLNGTYLGTERLLSDRFISLKHGDVIGIGTYIDIATDDSFIFQIYQRILNQADLPCTGDNFIVPIKEAHVENRESVCSITTSSLLEEGASKNVEAIPLNRFPTSKDNELEMINLECSSMEDEEEVKLISFNEPGVISSKTGQTTSTLVLSSDEDDSVDIFEDKPIIDNVASLLDANRVVRDKNNEVTDNVEEKNKVTFEEPTSVEPLSNNKTDSTNSKDEKTGENVIEDKSKELNMNLETARSLLEEGASKNVEAIPLNRFPTSKDSELEMINLECSSMEDEEEVKLISFNQPGVISGKSVQTTSTLVLSSDEENSVEIFKDKPISDNVASLLDVGSANRVVPDKNNEVIDSIEEKNKVTFEEPTSVEPLSNNKTNSTNSKDEKTGNNFIKDKSKELNMNLETVVDNSLCKHNEQMKEEKDIMSRVDSSINTTHLSVKMTGNIISKTDKTIKKNIKRKSFSEVSDPQFEIMVEKDIVSESKSNSISHESFIDDDKVIIVNNGNDLPCSQMFNLKTHNKQTEEEKDNMLSRVNSSINTKHSSANMSGNTISKVCEIIKDIERKSFSELNEPQYEIMDGKDIVSGSKTNSISHESFTDDDNVIIINDDDELPCSQMFDFKNELEEESLEPQGDFKGFYNEEDCFSIDDDSSDTDDDEWFQKLSQSQNTQSQFSQFQLTVPAGNISEGLKAEHEKDGSELDIISSDENKEIFEINKDLKNGNIEKEPNTIETGAALKRKLSNLLLDEGYTKNFKKTKDLEDESSSQLSEQLFRIKPSGSKRKLKESSDEEEDPIATMQEVLNLNQQHINDQVRNLNQTMTDSTSSKKRVKIHSNSSKTCSPQTSKIKNKKRLSSEKGREVKLSLKSNLNSDLKIDSKHAVNNRDEPKNGKKYKKFDDVTRWKIDVMKLNFLKDMEEMEACENQCRSAENEKLQSSFDDVDNIKIDTTKKIHSSEVSLECNDLPQPASKSIPTVMIPDNENSKINRNKSDDRNFDVSNIVPVVSNKTPRFGTRRKQINASNKKKELQIVDAKALPVDFCEKAVRTKQSTIVAPGKKVPEKKSIQKKNSQLIPNLVSKSELKDIRREKLKSLSEANKGTAVVSEKVKHQNTVKNTAKNITKITIKNRNEMLSDAIVSNDNALNKNNHTGKNKGSEKNMSYKKSLSNYKIPCRRAHNPDDLNISKKSEIEKTSATPENSSKSNVIVNKSILQNRIPITHISANENNGFLVDHIISSTLSNSTVNQMIGTTLSRPTESVSGIEDKQSDQIIKRIPDHLKLPVNNVSSLKPILKVTKEKCSGNKVKFCLPDDSKKVVYVDIRKFAIEENARLRPYSKSNIATIDFPPPKQGTDNTVPKNTDYFVETIHCICTWNCVWFSEKDKCKGEPGVYKGQLYHLKDVYISYNDYRRGVFPLMLYELWQSVSKHHDIIQKRIKPFTIEIKNYSRRPVINSFMMRQKENEEKALIALNCQVLLGDKDQMTRPSSGDIVVLDIKQEGNDQTVKDLMNNQRRILAYVYRINIRSVASHRDVSLRLKKQNPKASMVMDFGLYIMERRPQIDFKSANTHLAILKNIKSELRRFTALDQLASSPLLDLILDPSKNNQPLPYVDLQKTLYNQIDHLNASQKKAVLTVAEVCLTQPKSIHYIHGPPGCGKSEVIIGIIMKMWLHKCSGNDSFHILLCAPSNSAIDDIFLRLLNFRQLRLKDCPKFNMVRIGHSENRSVRHLCLDTIVDRELKMRDFLGTDEERLIEISRLEAKMNKLTNLLDNISEAQKNDVSYTRDLEFKLAEYQKNIATLKKNKGKILLEGNELREKKKELQVKILGNANIVCTTLSSCFNHQMEQAYLQRRLTFDCCIVDEAAQSTEIETLIPLMLGVNNLVLVGDPKQLQPTILSEKAKELGYQRSLFARHHEYWMQQPTEVANNNYHFLNMQYRMHPAIAEWPFQFFYERQIHSDESLESRSLQFPLQPYVVLSHEHLQSCQEECNYEEAKMVGTLVNMILTCKLFQPETTIGVITPYNQQKDLIRKKVTSTGNVEIGSVDSYQGRERDIIIFSCMRTEGVGFMSGMERLNVALTRARHSLIIIGNFKSLQKNQTWASLLSNAQSRGVYRHLSHSHPDLLREVLKPGCA